MIDISLKKQLMGSLGSMQLDIKLTIYEGDFLTIYGDSGAGKTSILRMIAGLMDPEKGIIKVGDQTWFHSEKGTNVKPQQRQVGMVFQDYALFPNMTIEENLHYAKAKNDSSTSKIIEELLELTELKDLRKRKIATLSGGQKQRLALARSIVPKPKILLLDEPLSALDASMRNKLQGFLSEIHRRYHLTTVLVSHEVSEVIKLSNRVIHLEYGKISRDSAPEEAFLNKNVSGKIQFIGEIIQIKKEDVIYVVSVLINKNIIKVIATANEIENISPGDKVMVASKAFNPIIQKIKDN